MKGLLLKDLLGLKKYMRTLGTLLLFYIILGATTKAPEFISAMMVVICAMIPMVAFSYDATAKWDSFGLTLPVTRRDVVLSRYVLAFIFIAVGALLSVIFSLLLAKAVGKDPAEVMSTALCGFAASIVLNSIVLPAIYKFGVEKGRFVIFGFFAFVMIVAFSISQLHIPAPGESTIIALIDWSPLFAGVLFVISFFVSCKIYSDKEI